mmetsp:Transcript_22558/g.53250  ORF Transcript_22558/g.53250 Transcript_22558/m.53250 type:complete len:136 (-) Transcript_22558:58-465(-)
MHLIPTTVSLTLRICRKYSYVQVFKSTSSHKTCNCNLLRGFLLNILDNCNLLRWILPPLHKTNKNTMSFLTSMMDIDRCYLLLCPDGNSRDAFPPKRSVMSDRTTPKIFLVPHWPVARRVRTPPISLSRRAKSPA